MAHRNGDVGVMQAKCESSGRLVVWNPVIKQRTLADGTQGCVIGVRAGGAGCLSGLGCPGALAVRLSRCFVRVPLRWVGSNTIEGCYVEDVVRFDVHFSDPRPPSDGWAFQLFIDTDADLDTGYGGGQELLVRGVEMTLNQNDVPSLSAGNVFLRRIDGGSGPGGWGIDVATVSVWILDDGRRLGFEVPLIEELGIGAFRYHFESYHAGRREGMPDMGNTVGLDVRTCVSLRSCTRFVDCVTGPDQLVVQTSQFCLLAFDYDGDSDIDLRDFSSATRCAGDQP